MLESVWACRWRLELGRTRSARFSPTYSAVVQPCYINVSVSGCLGLFTCQRFPAHSVCLLLSHPLLVHLFQVKHTPTQPHVIKKKEKIKKKVLDDITEKEWLEQLWSKIWFDDLQYHSQRDSPPSVSGGTVRWFTSFTYQFIDSWSVRYRVNGTSAPPWVAPPPPHQVAAQTFWVEKRSCGKDVALHHRTVPVLEGCRSPHMAPLFRSHVAAIFAFEGFSEWWEILKSSQNPAGHEEMTGVMIEGSCETFITVKAIYENLPEDPLTVWVGVNSANKLLPPCFGTPDLEGKTKISPHCQELFYFICPSVHPS